MNLATRLALPNYETSKEAGASKWWIWQWGWCFKSYYTRLALPTFDASNEAGTSNFWGKQWGWRCQIMKQAMRLALLNYKAGTGFQTMALVHNEAFTSKWQRLMLSNDETTNEAGAFKWLMIQRGKSLNKDHSSKMVESLDEAKGLRGGCRRNSKIRL